MNDAMSAESLRAITEAATAGLSAVLEQFVAAHPEELIYSFGPYIPYDTGYAGVALFTESGLEQVANRYEHDGHGSGPELIDDLRWSPADSPFHGYRSELLSETDSLLGDHRNNDDATHVGTEDEHEEHWEARVAARTNALAAALEAVDFDRLVGERRSDIVLCLWGGDQSDEERVAFVQALNPPEVVERFLSSYGVDV